MNNSAARGPKIMKKILQGREKFPASPNVEYTNIDLITELKIAFFCFNCSIVLETKEVYSNVWTLCNWNKEIANISVKNY